MLFDILLVVVLVICFVTDFKRQKIYNAVIFPSLVTAYVLNIFFSGFNGFKFSLLGFFTGLCILLIPYLLGGMGAGDVKLLSFIGALKGSFFVLNTAVYMALIGGVIALMIIMFRKDSIKFIKSIFLWLFSFFSGVKYTIDFSTSGFSQKYPYGTAIVLGAFICLLFKGAWII
ncbi:MAG: prepilin peptidase [Clostridiaceae bacterium]